MNAALEGGDRACFRAIVLILLAVYSATFVGLPDNPDAEVEFQTVSALARDGTLALGGTPEAEAIVAIGFDVRRGVDGRAYAWFGVGQALVALPFYAAGRGLARIFPAIEERNAATTHYGVPRSEYFAHLLVGWRNPLLGALTAGIVFVAARRLGASRRAGLLAALGYGLCSFAWPQSRSTLSDVQAAFFLALAFERFVKLREELRGGAPPRRMDLAVAGAALGLAFLTRLLVAPAVLVLGLATLGLLVRRWKRRSDARGHALDAAALSLPALASIAVFLWVNHLRFGDVLESGYGAFASGSSFNYPVHLGLAGLLLSPGRGLLWMVPLLWLVPLGWSASARNSGRGIVFLIAALLLALLLPVACNAGWYGGWTYGPRYALPIVPILAATIGPAFDALTSRLARLATGALFALGFAVALPGSLVGVMGSMDLAIQAARLEWPEVPGDSELARDEQRFVSMQWEPRYAAPLVHWKLFAARVAGSGEEFDAGELFGVESSSTLRPTHERDRGFQHLAWVDLAARLGGSPWVGFVLCVPLLALGLVAARRGLALS